MGVSHSKQLDISSTPKKAEMNGKAQGEEIKPDERITVRRRGHQSVIGPPLKPAKNLFVS